MTRATTAYASKYQLDRVHETDLYRAAKVRLTVDFGGALGAETISTVRWYTSAPWSTILSAPAISGKRVTVFVQGSLPDLSMLKCEVTLSNGEVRNQFWRVRVGESNYYGGETIPAAGPEFVSA